MENIERRVRREARAMTRREVITKAIAKQLTWIQAAEIIGIKPRQMRRIRSEHEHAAALLPLPGLAGAGHCGDNIDWLGRLV